MKSNKLIVEKKSNINDGKKYNHFGQVTNKNLSVVQPSDNVFKWLLVFFLPSL